MHWSRSCPPVFIVLGSVLVGLTLAGCSSKPRQQEEPAQFRLRKIAQAYQLASEIRGKPPRDAAELSRYFKELGEVGDPAELLRSPRDGEPYVIVFGVDFDSEARNTVLGYEKTGADGSRYVLTLAREVKLLKNEEFARATFAKDHKPPSGQ